MTELVRSKAEQIFGVDFTFVPDFVPTGDKERVESTPIKILSGPYAGVVYQYGKMTLEKVTEDGEGIMDFTYELLSDHDVAALHKDMDFKSKLGDILLSLIVGSLEEQLETRTNDSEGTVH